MNCSEKGKIRDFLEQSFLMHLSGKKMHECAVVIPAGKDSDLLEKHLRILEYQEDRCFDVIILGSEAKFVPRGLNVISYKEKVPLGSSGGFGLGQVLAFCMGYEYIINADVDCTPVSTDAVKKLKELSSDKQKLILPLSVYERNYDPKANRANYNVNQYGTIPARLLEKLGFMYFRFFKGGEDSEYIERAKLDGLIHCEPSIVVEHKNTESNFIERMKFRGAKYIYYEKNWPIVNIMIANLYLRRGRLFDCAVYSTKTFLNVIACMVVNGDQRDLLMAHIVDGLLLNMNARYQARRSELKICAGKEAFVVLDVCETRHIKNICFKPKEWLVKNPKPRVIEYLLSKQVEVLLAPVDYCEPTAKWIDEYKFFTGYALMAKPLKYLDGKIYRYGLGICELLIEVLAFTLVSPLLVLVILLDVLRAGATLDYPVTEENLMKNMGEYHKYLTGSKM